MKTMNELKETLNYFSELKSKENTADGSMRWQIGMTTLR